MFKSHNFALLLNARLVKIVQHLYRISKAFNSFKIISNFRALNFDSKMDQKRKAQAAGMGTPKNKKFKLTFFIL